MSARWPLFPTTVIGSMPRPGFVRDLLAARPPAHAPDPGWQRRMDAAVPPDDAGGCGGVSASEVDSGADLRADSLAGLECPERERIRYPGERLSRRLG